MSLWDQTFEEQTPFFKWGVSNDVELVFTKPIREYEIKEITTKFGKSSYISVLCNNQSEPNLLKIDSLRMRVALVQVLDKAKKFPIRVLLHREGSGFATQYSAKAL